MQRPSNNVLLILCSYHHGNTEKVAQYITNVLHAQIKAPDEVDTDELQEYDLIGFGSGICGAKHHPSLLALADRLPRADGKKAFLFSTDGMPRGLMKDEAALRKKMRADHAALREKLEGKGYEIVDAFNCAGFNTNSFLKSFGGVNKGRPDALDLAQAVEFAQRLREEWL